MIPRHPFPGEKESDLLSEDEVAVVEAGVTLAKATERLAVLLAAAEWGEGWVSECQEAKRDYLRAKVRFRLEMANLRRQGQS